MVDTYTSYEFRPFKTLGAVAKKFCADESGSATVESLFWMPVFAFFLVLITDISFFFNGRTQAMRILQESNRSYSIGRIETTDELETLVLQRIAPYAETAEVETTIENGVIKTTLSIPARELMATSRIAGLSDLVFDISSIQYIEG